MALGGVRYREGVALRAGEWFHRMNFPAGQRAPLGTAAELWDPAARNYEGHNETRVVMNTMVGRLDELNGGHGRVATDGEVVGELYAPLLGDLVVAAGGVEQAVRRFLDEVDRLQQDATRLGLWSTAVTVQGIGSAEGAWYAFADVVSWARIVQERLARPPPRKGGLRWQGLLPALAPGELRSRAQQLYDELLEGPYGEVRKLANFTLHAALIRSPHSGATVDTAGTVHLPFPDRADSPRIAHPSTLRFTQRRDAVTYTTDLWTAIQHFLDAVLTAFAAATPDRFRHPAPSGSDRSCAST